MRRWTPEEKATFARLKKAGKTHQAIADVLGKSKNAVNLYSGKVKAETSAAAMPAILPDPAPEAGGPTLPEPIPLSFDPFPITDIGTWLVINDIHLPYHDKHIVQLAFTEAKRRNAVGVLYNGDILDSGEISEHLRHNSAPKYVDEIVLGKQFFGWARAQLPNARHVYKEGNHEDRLDRYIMKKAPALEGLKGVDLPSFLELKDYGIEWINRKRIVRLGKLNVIHGHEYKGGISSPVNAARGLYLKARASAMAGHLHSTSTHPQPNIEGKVVVCWSVGCACFLHPDWHPINNWNHGFAFVDIEREGLFTVHNKQVIDGRIV
jgi:hypothetical protein